MAFPINGTMRVYAKQVHVSVIDRSPVSGAPVTYQAPVAWGTTVCGDGYVLEGPPSQLFGPEGDPIDQDPRILVERELWPTTDPHDGKNITDLAPWGSDVHFKWPNI